MILRCKSRNLSFDFFLHICMYMRHLFVKKFFLCDATRRRRRLGVNFLPSFPLSVLRLRSMNCGVFRRTQWNEHKARFVISSLLSDSKRASALFCSNAFSPLSRERPIKRWGARPPDSEQEEGELQNPPHVAARLPM